MMFFYPFRTEQTIVSLLECSRAVLTLQMVNFQYQGCKTLRYTIYCSTKLIVGYNTIKDNTLQHNVLVPSLQNMADCALQCQLNEWDNS